MSMVKKWILICFGNFLVAALMGLLLRFQSLSPVTGVNYLFLLHGHSHIAMLGWVYLALFALIYHFLIPKNKEIERKFNRLFWVTQLAVVGMMVAFPLQGYAVFSITFSTLHIFSSYYFARLVWKYQKIDSLPERYLLKTALVFMVLSTCGIWCLGPAVGLMGKTSAFYQIAIQFFLHFQFNGWFIIAVLALLFHQMQIKVDNQAFFSFYKWLVAGTLTTFALPVSWYVSHPILPWINGVGVVIQLVAFVKLALLLRPKFTEFYAKLKNIEKIVFSFALFSLTLKVLIQLLVIFPELASVSHQIRNFVIGFIHMIMLGIISGFLLGFLLNAKVIQRKNRFSEHGIKIFLMGFVLTEFLLFAQGFNYFLHWSEIPMYHQNLFISSIWLVIGIIMIIFSNANLKNNLK
ncbi:MAG TPA: hypothetical protein VLB74_09825 [Flavobacterium sp.]|uniref:hypothetical protein n=1 Tax=Flavobacterium sp. TaxID=239 RepID=UPI002CA21332|nr:hypothetical protein [Flavobacterium sp.]HSD14934.1 hypothetical protein [Flavobacterium sp.]